MDRRRFLGLGRERYETSETESGVAVASRATLLSRRNFVRGGAAAVLAASMIPGSGVHGAEAPGRQVAKAPDGFRKHVPPEVLKQQERAYLVVLANNREGEWATTLDPINERARRSFSTERARFFKQIPKQYPADLIRPDGTIENDEILAHLRTLTPEKAKQYINMVEMWAKGGITKENTGSLSTVFRIMNPDDQGNMQPADDKWRVYAENPDYAYRPENPFGVFGSTETKSLITAIKWGNSSQGIKYGKTDTEVASK